MSITITQSNKKDYIGRDFLFHLKKDQIIIGNKILGMGKKFEISCNDVKDENSKSIKETSGLKKTGGAIVGGFLTGGVGAIIGAMVTGNKTRKDLKINLGFKLKNKDWFVATLEVDDKNSLLGGIWKNVIEAVIKRFAIKSEAPF